MIYRAVASATAALKSTVSRTVIGTVIGTVSRTVGNTNTPALIGHAYTQSLLTCTFLASPAVVAVVDARRCYDKLKYRKEQRLIKKKRNQDDITFGHAFSVFQKYTLGQDLPVTAHIKVRLPEGSFKPLRGEVNFPSRVGQIAKSIVLVFATGEQAAEAKRLGADIVGGDELIQDILDDKLTFDRCLSTKDMFPKVIKIARKLGPKGLMPSPAKGTVSDDISEMMTSLQGSTKFDLDSNGMVQIEIGTDNKVEANLKALVDAVIKSKPSKQDASRFVETINISCPHTPALLLPNSRFVAKPRKKLSEVKALLHSYGMLRTAYGYKNLVVAK
ncbi:hypothetical protein BASA62_009893 [Batrachochytrium salamandrivorans]|nr:hypothetical protein BASA62_009893 [Batrachochytrium salamandrivorans]